MKSKEVKKIIRIVCATICVIIGLCIAREDNRIGIIIYGLAYGIIGFDIIYKAFCTILRGQVFDENFLMTVATIGAFATSEYIEGVLVMLLYQIGELFQEYAVSKSRKSITDLMDIEAEYANVKERGSIIKKDPEDVHIGDIIVVKTGEKVPLDGIVQEGEATLDTAALTGESLPRYVKKSDEICSGSMNLSGVLTVKVTKEYEDTTAVKILQLVEMASDRKAKAENFVTRFAAYYTPIVVVFALILAFLPPLFISDLTVGICMKRAMTFLVISCPCALVISIPLSFFGGIGGASKRGILIKGSTYIEALSKVNTIAFDKTGTLTKGIFEVVEIVPRNISREELLQYTASCEYYSNHPLAISIKKAYGKEVAVNEIKDVEELAGQGMCATVLEKRVCVGNIKLMRECGVDIEEVHTNGTVLYVSINKEFVGYIVVFTLLKKEAVSVIQNLRENHLKIVVLTGDSKKATEPVIKVLQPSSYAYELMPSDKVQKVEELLNEKGTVAFVGDGINDAPVLMRSDVGIAMGSLGSDVAIEAADVVIMNDNLENIPVALYVAKKTMKIVRENIVMALSLKLLFLILGAFGITNMMGAIFADVGVSILAILNAMRTLYGR